MERKTKTLNFAGAALLVASSLFFGTAVRGADDAFPEGPGKQTFLRVCQACHDVESIPRLHYSKDEWSSLVYSMKDMGADATGDELDQIIGYLAKNFGKDTKKDDSKSGDAKPDDSKK